MQDLEKFEEATSKCRVGDAGSLRRSKGHMAACTSAMEILTHWAGGQAPPPYALKTTPGDFHHAVKAEIHGDPAH